MDVVGRCGSFNFDVVLSDIFIMGFSRCEYHA